MSDQVLIYPTKTRSDLVGHMSSLKKNYWLPFVIVLKSMGLLRPGSDAVLFMCRT